jgi:hypothetical protein
VRTPKNLPEKPSAIPLRINKVLSKLLPNNSKNIARNKAMIERRIERIKLPKLVGNGGAAVV